MLKFYKDEIKLFGKTKYYKKVLATQCHDITNELCSLFGLPKIEVSLRKRNGAVYSKRRSCIILPKGWTPTGLILHEFGHYLDINRRGTSGHDPIFMEVLKEVWFAYREVNKP